MNALPTTGELFATKKNGANKIDGVVALAMASLEVVCRASQPFGVIAAF